MDLVESTEVKMSAYCWADISLRQAPAAQLAAHLVKARRIVILAGGRGTSTHAPECLTGGSEGGGDGGKTQQSSRSSSSSCKRQ